MPPNLKFIVDDVEDEWGYEGSPFDYIHGRFLIASIRDWPRLIKQAFTYATYLPSHNLLVRFTSGPRLTSIKVHETRRMG